MNWSECLFLINSFLKGWNLAVSIQSCVLKVGPISQLVVMGMPEISFLKVCGIQ